MALVSVAVIMDVEFRRRRRGEPIGKGLTRDIVVHLLNDDRRTATGERMGRPLSVFEEAVGMLR